MNGKSVLHILSVLPVCALGAYIVAVSTLSKQEGTNFWNGKVVGGLKSRPLPFFQGTIAHMDKLHKEALQVSKEIVVKFIEAGRVSPANFAEVFPSIHKVVRETILDAMLPVPDSLRDTASPSGRK